MGNGCGCLVTAGLIGLGIWVLTSFSVHTLLVIVVVLLVVGMMSRE